MDPLKGSGDADIPEVSITTFSRGSDDLQSSGTQQSVPVNAATPPLANTENEIVAIMQKLCELGMHPDAAYEKAILIAKFRLEAQANTVIQIQESNRRTADLRRVNLDGHIHALRFGAAIVAGIALVIGGSIALLKPDAHQSGTTMISVGVTLLGFGAGVGTPNQRRNRDE